MDNVIGIALPVSQEVPMIVSNMHLIPRGHAGSAATPCMLQTSAFHARHPRGIKLVPGDINADFADTTGNWLRKACVDNGY